MPKVIQNWIGKFAALLITFLAGALVYEVFVKKTFDRRAKSISEVNVRWSSPRWFEWALPKTTAWRIFFPGSTATLVISGPQSNSELLAELISTCRAISGIMFLDESAKPVELVLEALASSESLEYVAFVQVPLDLHDWEILSNMKQVRRMELESMDIGVGEIARICKLKQLRELDTFDVPLGIEEVKALVLLGKFQKLTIDGESVSQAAVEYLKNHSLFELKIE